jgi:hypothetical protein
MVEGRVRARAIAAAFRNATGLLMRRDNSWRANEALESEVSAHLDKIKGLAFGRYDPTPDSLALMSAEASTGGWWIVRFLKRQDASDIRPGDVYLSPEQIADAMDFENDLSSLNDCPNHLDAK